MNQKKPACELIETMLESLKSAHTGINKQLEFLIEVAGYEEDDCVALKSEADKLYLLNMAMQEYIAATLRKDFNSTTVKEELLRLRTYRLLEGNGNEKSALDWFARKYLDD